MVFALSKKCLLDADDGGREMQQHANEAVRCRRDPEWAWTILVIAATFLLFVAAGVIFSSSLEMTKTAITTPTLTASASAEENTAAVDSGGALRRVLQGDGDQEKHIIAYSQKEWSNAHQDMDAPKQPFFGENNQVNILQMGDETFKDRYKKHTSFNRLWAESTKYQYYFKAFDTMHEHGKEERCPYTQNVTPFRDFLVDEIPLDEWKIFLDLDVYFQSSDKAELDKDLNLG
jgi:hypothetical protein